MSAKSTNSVVSAFTASNLVELVEANEHGPDITEEMAERIIDLSERRTNVRSEDSMHVEKDYLVMTAWDRFCRNTFDSDTVGGDSVPNRFALVSPNFDVSSGRDAWLCEDAVVVQQGWLKSGDSRRTQLEEVDVTHTEYVSDVKTFWAPKEYTAIVGFSDDLVSPDTKMADAM